MSRAWRWMAVAVVAAGAVAWQSRTPPPADPVAPANGVAGLLAGDARGFATATAPARLVFPADHGPHPRFRSEWWYFTGHLRGSGGARYGFQLTFFRFAVASVAPARSSRWAADQVLMAHFAVTDAGRGRFHADERFERQALGLAGAARAPFRLWLGNWSAEGGAGLLPVRLRAAGDGASIDLVVDPGKPLVLQGDRGLSRKSSAPGNASYYYSYTRLPVTGTLAIDGEGEEVSGEAWFDHEWGSSTLAADQRGWDWFAVQLDDRRELMYYRLRRDDGSADATSAGVIVDPAGRLTRLSAGDVRIVAGARWRSPASGAEYPRSWRLEVPAAGLTLDLEALLEGQEQGRVLRYWEGAHRVSGRSAQGPVSGQAYVELVGYPGSAVAPR